MSEEQDDPGDAWKDEAEDEQVADGDAEDLGQADPDAVEASPEEAPPVTLPERNAEAAAASHPVVDGGKNTDVPRGDGEDARVRPLTVQTARDRAKALTREDTEEIETLLRGCHQAKFTPGQVKLVEEEITEATGWSASSMTAISRDQRGFRENHGVLYSKLMVSTAIVAEWKESYTDVVYADGALYFYISDAHKNAAETPAAERGFYVRKTREEAAAFVCEFAGELPIVPGRTARKEILETACELISRAAFFDSAQSGVNTNDCFVAWDETEKRIKCLPHSPAHRARVKLVVDYHDGAEAPVFLAGLARVLRDPALQQVVQEFFACCLFGLRPPKDGERGAMIFIGEARTGKTTIIQVLESFFPPEAVSHVPPTDWHQAHSRAQLAGKVLNTVTELPGNKLVTGDNFKLIVSRETFNARYQYEKPFEARFPGWNALACNDAPRTDDQSEGFARRVAAVPFRHPIPKDEVSGDFLETVRRDELAGVLRWAAEAIPGLLERGYMALPEAHEECLMQMQFPGDHVYRAAKLGVMKEEGAKIYTTELRALLREVHAEMHLAGEADGNGEMRRLSAWLTKLYGAERSASNNDPYYKGVRLRGWPKAGGGGGLLPVSPPGPGPGPRGGHDSAPKRLEADAPDNQFDEPRRLTPAVA